MLRCTFSRKIHDKRFKEYFRCKKDGSLRTEKSCRKCPRYVPSLWQKIKSWFSKHFY